MVNLEGIKLLVRPIDVEKKAAERDKDMARLKSV
jgi:hypothetical protein